MSNQFDAPPSKKVNVSGLLPLGRAVLLDPIQEKKGLIQLPDSVADRYRMIQDRAVVIDHGPECWIDESVPRARVGDEVFIVYMAGRDIKGNDGKTYRLVNDKDIFCRIVKESKESKEVTDNG